MQTANSGDKRTANLDAALALVARGWPVFPLHQPVGDGCSCGRACGPTRRGKHPRTARGFKDATLVTDQIREWWRRWPSANIGVATGARSGLLILDVDGAIGEESLAALVAAKGPIPTTIAVRTGRGRHLYFAQPQGVYARSSAGRLAPGLDVRGDCGYVIGAGSRHSSGARYEWSPGCAPTETPIAAPPQWLLAHCAVGVRREQPTTSTKTKSADTSSAARAIPEGRRNSQLYALAAALRARGVGDAGVAAAVHAENRGRCRPPLDVAEVDSIVASSARCPESPRSRRPIVLRDDERAVNDEVVAALAGELQLFQRAGHLVRIVSEPSSDVRPANAAFIEIVPETSLRELISSRAEFIARYTDSDGREHVKRAHPPHWCAGQIASRRTWPAEQIRPLHMLAEAPLLLPDGSILTAPGYDPASGVVLLANVGVDVPTRPSPKQVRRAREALDDVICDFPFAAPAHRAAWIAALLTVSARAAFRGPAPLFLLDAPTPGSGKTILSALVAEIALGRPGTTVAPAESDAEDRKRITAFGIAGDRLVTIDNVSGTLGGAALCAALTLPDGRWSDRKLGAKQSRMEAGS